MTRYAKYLVAAAAIGGIAAPALAQAPYPYYPQPTYPQGYPQQGYGQQPGYGQNPVQSIIDQLLGNRYNVNDQAAIRRCATAAVAQASRQYPPRGYAPGYNQYPPRGYAPGYNQYPQGYNQYGQQQYGQPYAYGARVTAISNVERRGNNRLRVSGMIDSGRYPAAAYGNQGRYGQQGYAYGNPAYAAGAGDLTFRCDVDYRGAVSNLRVRQNNVAYRR